MKRNLTKCTNCEAVPTQIYKGKRLYCDVHAPTMAKPYNPPTAAITYAFEKAAAKVDTKPVEPVLSSENSHRGSTNLPESLQKLPLAPAPDYDEGFGLAHARTYDPDTSKEAAKNVSVSARCEETLYALYKVGGAGITEDCTDWINHTYGRSEIPSNLSPRVSQLRKKGLVEERGEKRLSRQAGPCTVWFLTDAGFDCAKKIEKAKEYTQ